MKATLYSFLILITFSASGQGKKPVNWTFTSEKKSSTEAELIFTCKIDTGWHIYSQNTPDGGPLPLLITFDSTKCYTRIDKVIEPKPIEEYDSVFNVKVLYHQKEIVMKQKIKYSQEPCEIKGHLEYQACKSVCIPLDTVFTFTIGSGKPKAVR